MSDHYLPTIREFPSIKRMAKLQARTQVIVFVTPVLLLASVAASRALTGDVSWLLFIPAAVLFVAELGLIAYVSFCLRCPRCSTWVGLGIPKCASCGLKLKIPKAHSRHWHPDMPSASQ